MIGLEKDEYVFKNSYGADNTFVRIPKARKTYKQILNAKQAPSTIDASYVDSQASGNGTEPTLFVYDMSYALNFRKFN